MGEVHARATFVGPRGRKTVRLLVDTGSTYTWLPGPLLRTLGAASERRVEFDAGEGQRVTRPIGRLEVEVLGRSGETVVVFGRPAEAGVLGLHALEGLTLTVDPTRRALRRGRKARR